jgi:hypothetical protein
MKFLSFDYKILKSKEIYLIIKKILFLFYRLKLKIFIIQKLIKFFKFNQLFLYFYNMLFILIPFIIKYYSFKFIIF